MYFNVITWNEMSEKIQANISLSLLLLLFFKYHVFVNNSYVGKMSSGASFWNIPNCLNFGCIICEYVYTQRHTHRETHTEHTNTVLAAQKHSGSCRAFFLSPAVLCQDEPTSQNSGRKSGLLLCFLEWHLILPSS